MPGIGPYIIGGLCWGGGGCREMRGAAAVGGCDGEDCGAAGGGPRCTAEGGAASILSTGTSRAVSCGAEYTGAGSSFICCGPGSSWVVFFLDSNAHRNTAQHMTPIAAAMIMPTVEDDDSSSLLGGGGDVGDGVVWLPLALFPTVGPEPADVPVPVVAVLLAGGLPPPVELCALGVAALLVEPRT